MIKRKERKEMIGFLKNKLDLEYKIESRRAGM